MLECIHQHSKFAVIFVLVEAVYYKEKIALLLFDPTTTWKDIWDEDHFHSFYKRLFPGYYNSAVASTSQNNEEATFLTVSPMAGKNTPAPPFNFTDSDLMCFDNEPLSPHGDQPKIHTQMSFFFHFELLQTSTERSNLYQTKILLSKTQQ